MPDTDIIREARELCERATPGTWETLVSIDPKNNAVDYFVQQVHGHPAYRIDVKAYGEQQSADDTAFIARSRTLIPDLLDLLAAKDAEIARLTEAIHKADINCDHCKHSHGGECENADFDCMTCDCDCICKSCRDNNNWEWRGATDN